jgi:hypothetical protein
VLVIISPVPILKSVPPLSPDLIDRGPVVGWRRAMEEYLRLEFLELVLLGLLILINLLLGLVSSFLDTLGAIYPIESASAYSSRKNSLQVFRGSQV